MVTSWFFCSILSHTGGKSKYQRTSRGNFPVDKPFSGAKVLDCAKVSFTVPAMRLLPVSYTADAVVRKTPGKLPESADMTRKP